MLVTMLVGLTLAWIIDRRTHAIGAMSKWNSAELPQRMLQTIAQRLKTLRVTKIHGFPVRVRQHEVVNQVLQRLACDGHVEAGHVCEVGRSEVTGMMRLAEEDFLRGTFGGSPLLDATLKRSQLSILKLAFMFSLQPCEDRLGLQARIQPQLFFDLGPDRFERIFPSPPIMLDLRFAGQLRQCSIPPCCRLRHPAPQSSQTQRLP